jgi:hypothetical protein
VAEWLGRGLQNPVHRFNSGPDLHKIETRIWKLESGIWDFFIAQKLSRSPEHNIFNLIGRGARTVFVKRSGMYTVADEYFRMRRYTNRDACRDGGTGIRMRLKISGPQGIVGSTPTRGTKNNSTCCFYFCHLQYLK